MCFLFIQSKNYVNNLLTYYYMWLWKCLSINGVLGKLEIFSTTCVAQFIRNAKKVAMLTLVLHVVILDKSNAYFSIVYANFSMLNEAIISHLQ